MLEQLANQFLAMNAKSARNLVGSLSRLQKGGFSITDDQGAVDATEKPRISTASLGYGMSGRNYDSKPFHFIDGIAIIPVMGTLVHKLSYFSSWATGYNVIVGMFDAYIRFSRAAMTGKAKDKVPDDLSIFDEVRVCRTQLDEQCPGWSSPLKQLTVAALSIYQLRKIDIRAPCDA